MICINAIYTISGAMDIKSNKEIAKEKTFASIQTRGLKHWLFYLVEPGSAAAMCTRLIKKNSGSAVKRTR